MKRFTRTVVSGMVGLILGWYVAGIVPGLTVSRAQGTGQGHAQGGHEGHRHADVDQHFPGVHPGQIDQARSGAVGSDHGGRHATSNAAPMLVPQAADLSWFRPIVGAVLALFAAAMVVGVLHRPAPLGPVADHSHGNQDH